MKRTIINGGKSDEDGERCQELTKLSEDQKILVV
jgi:hypothetical protein